jgi:hypothetical protein
MGGGTTTRKMDLGGCRRIGSIWSRTTVGLVHCSSFLVRGYVGGMRDMKYTYDHGLGGGATTGIRGHEYRHGGLDRVGAL